MDLASIGELIASRRKALGVTQISLVQKSGISRATIDALENGRAGELGFSKVNRLLSALGLEISVRASSPRRPTLEDLLEENRSAEGLDR